MNTLSFNDVILSREYYNELVKKSSKYTVSYKNEVDIMDHGDPEEVFIETAIDVNVGRLLIFIMWLNRRSDSYRQYRFLVLKYTNVWVVALLKLAKFLQ